MSTEQGLLILALCPVQKRALGSSLPSVCSCALLAPICEVALTMLQGSSKIKLPPPTGGVTAPAALMERFLHLLDSAEVSSPARVWGCPGLCGSKACSSSDSQQKRRGAKEC